MADLDKPLQALAGVTILVRDYEEAITYYCDTLGFALIEDTLLTADKRWVLVAPRPSSETRLLLAKAATPEQAAAVGRQAGGRLFLFLETDDFACDYAAMTARGVSFMERPRHETYGTVAVFEDLYGNRWDLIERRHQ